MIVFPAMSFGGGLQTIPFLLGRINALRGVATRENINNYFADAFFDQNGVDLAASVNKNYNSGGQYYEGTTSQAATSGPVTLTTVTNSGTLTARTVINAAQISTSSTGKIILRFKGPSSGSQIITRVFVGQAAASGNAYDFDGSQVQVFFRSGSASVTLGVNELLDSDPVTYPLDETKNLVIAIEHTNSNHWYTNTATTGYQTYQGPGATGNITVGTGYSSWIVCMSCYEVDVVVQNNLDLVSNAYTSPRVPQRANVVAVYNPIVAATLNTDYIVYMSRNNGTNYYPVTLTAGGASGISGYNYAYGEIDLSATASGTTMRERLFNWNLKNIRDGGMAASYY